jgi:hypothetical protein
MFYNNPKYILMTIEQSIVQYLYKNKAVSLQNVGNFSIPDDIVIPYDNDNETALPENAIDFKYDAHAKQDDGLVVFIVENTKKIKSLAESDLESYIALNKQFINLGKAHTIVGLGTIQKAQDGTYTFTQATSSQVVTKEIPKVVKEKPKQNIDFSSPKNDTGNSNIAKYAIMGLLGVLLLGGIGYGGYWVYENYKANSMDSATVKNSVTESGVKKETNGLKDTTNNIKTQPTVADTNSFYIVINEFTNREEAERRMRKLNDYGNHFVVTSKDSAKFKLKLPFKLALTDTLRVKDSISVYFGAKGYVELPN